MINRRRHTSSTSGHKRTFTSTHTHENITSPDATGTAILLQRTTACTPKSVISNYRLVTPGQGKSMNMSLVFARRTEWCTNFMNRLGGGHVATFWLEPSDLRMGNQSKWSGRWYMKTKQSLPTFAMRWQNEPLRFRIAKPWPASFDV